MLRFLCVYATMFALAGCGSADDRPNVLIIVADDLGYSDIGVFGGEIGTPNLDQLASQGLQLTHFHTATNCSPTRAMLMTGMDNHKVGLGTMAEVMALRYPELNQFPGYEGYLNFRAKPLPEVMRDAGYRTYMTGKWHLGLEKETSPYARGFQQTYAMVEGAAGHLDDRQYVPGINRERVIYRRNGEVTEIPEDFYSTAAFADELIGFLRKDQDRPEPFFAYLAFTAPHWPLQAPESSIQRYKGKYDQGYDELFAARLSRQKSLGLIAEDVEGQIHQPGAKPWSELTDDEQAYSARLMEVYAAMVGDMDYHIGEVLQAIEDMGELDNTVVLFMSDNGAEGNTADRAPAWRKFVDAGFDNSYENLGAVSSYVFYGTEWARVSALPSRLFKSNPTQGGILSPAILSYGAALGESRRYNEFLSVMDVMPTVLELAGIEYSGEEELPIMGRSFASLLTDANTSIHPEDFEMGWEMVDHRAYRLGDWKLVMTQPPRGDGSWELYNLADDPSENKNLAEQEPALFAELQARWHSYAERNDVVVFENGKVPTR